jgi:hypothetical protein
MVNLSSLIYVIMIIKLPTLMCGADLVRARYSADITLPATACINALFGQIKYAQSIEKLSIHLFPSNRVPMLDMKQFVQSNKRTLPEISRDIGSRSS